MTSDPLPKVKFRWFRTVETHSKEVYFSALLLNEESIKLEWQNLKDLYESAANLLPCGHYQGFLTVDGKRYSCDPFEINSYIFEITLTLKDDISADIDKIYDLSQSKNVTFSNFIVNNDSNKSYSFHVDNKQEEFYPEISIEDDSEIIANKSVLIKEEQLCENFNTEIDQTSKNKDDFSEVKCSTPKSKDLIDNSSFQKNHTRNTSISLSSLDHNHYSSLSQNFDHYNEYSSFALDKKNQESEKIKTLQTAMENLDDLLKSKSSEVTKLITRVSELESENRRYREDLKDLITDKSTTMDAQKIKEKVEAEQRFIDLLKEKEKLEDEAQKLRKMISLNHQSSESPSNETVSPTFDIISPKVLKRKIDGLTSELNDLKETHEETVVKLALAEKRIHELQEENLTLRRLAEFRHEPLQNGDFGESPRSFLNQRLSQSCLSLPVRDKNSNEVLTNAEDQCRNYLDLNILNTSRYSSYSNRSRPELSPYHLRNDNSLQFDRYAKEVDFKAGSLKSLSCVDDQLSTGAFSVENLTTSVPRDYYHKQSSSGSSTSTDTILNEATNELENLKVQFNNVHQDYFSNNVKGNKYFIERINNQKSTLQYNTESRSLNTDFNSASINSSRSYLYPFIPHSPSAIHKGSIVKFIRPGGKITKGEVKYVGSLPGRKECYVGIELDKEDGTHDGVYEGRRIFQCKPKKGVFVAFSKLVMAYA